MITLKLLFFFFYSTMYDYDEEIENCFGHTQLDPTGTQNQVLIDGRYLPFANFSMAIHQHGFENRKEKYLLDCIGLDSDFRFHVPLFPIDLKSFDSFFKKLLEFADKHAHINERIMRKGRINESIREETIVREPV